MLLYFIRFYSILAKWIIHKVSENFICDSAYLYGIFPWWAALFSHLPDVVSDRYVHQVCCIDSTATAGSWELNICCSDAEGRVVCTCAFVHLHIQMDKLNTCLRTYVRVFVHMNLAAGSVKCMVPPLPSPDSLSSTKCQNSELRVLWYSYFTSVKPV